MKIQFPILLFLFPFIVALIGVTSCEQTPKQYYVINEDGKYGYIDSLGNKVIEPSYFWATQFSDGLALVVSDTSWIGNSFGTIPDELKINYHYIDYSGKTVGKKNYTAFFNGTLCISFPRFKEVMSRFLYSDGRALFQYSYTDSTTFSSEVHRYKYGYINKKGKLVIPCDYDSGSPFHDGKALVQESFEELIDNGHMDNKWKVITLDGTPLSDYIFSKGSSFVNNRCLTTVYSKDNTEGQNANNNQRIIHVLLDENAKIIKTFPNGLKMKLFNEYIVNEAGRAAFFNIGSEFYYARNGEDVPKSHEMSSAWIKNVSKARGFLNYPLGEDVHISYVKGISEGLCVCTTGKEDCDTWFFSDVHGFLYGNQKDNLYVFEDAKTFSSGLAAVKLDGKWGYINHDFNIVIPCQYDTADPFNGSLAYVEEDHGELQISSYINRYGTIVWQNTKLSRTTDWLIAK